MRSSIDLGLAISALSLKPGERRDYREIAAFCDCSWQRIQQIEQKALRKLRVKLQFHHDPVLVEAVQSLITH